MKANFKRVMKVVTTFALTLAFLITAVAPAAVDAATAPKLNKTAVTLTAGKTFTLKVINPVKSSTVAWSSSNAKVASVSKKGVVKAVSSGTATVTAKISVNKKVTNTLKATITVKAAATSAPTQAPAGKKPLVYNDFSKSVGDFMARGTASLQWVNKPGFDGKNGYMSVTGRSAAWHGANMDVTSYVKPGKSYTVTGWVKYTDGAASEDFKITQQKNGGSWPAISGVVTVKKGEWTKVSGTMTVDSDTTTCEVYFETDTNTSLDFLADEFSIVEQ